MGLNEELEQKARASLLQYYSNKCTAHGTSILTIAIGFFVYAQAHTHLMQPFPLIIQSVLNALILSTFLTLFTHQAARLMLWAKYTTHIVTIEPDSREFGRNLLHEFHMACYRKMRKTFLYKIAAKRVVVLFPAVWTLLLVAFFLYGYMPRLL